MESIVIADLDQISLTNGLKIRKWILEEKDRTGIGAHNISSPTKTEDFRQLKHTRFEIRTVPTKRDAADNQLKQMLSRKLKSTIGPVHIVLVSNDKSFRNDIRKICMKIAGEFKITYINSASLRNESRK